MAEVGSRRPASAKTADANLERLRDEFPRRRVSSPDMIGRSEALRRELADKGLKGFKKGGKVAKTGVYKLHKGETVAPAKKAPSKPKGKRKP